MLQQTGNAFLSMRTFLVYILGEDYLARPRVMPQAFLPHYVNSTTFSASNSSFIMAPSWNDLCEYAPAAVKEIHIHTEMFANQADCQYCGIPNPHNPNGRRFRAETPAAETSRDNRGLSREAYTPFVDRELMPPPPRPSIQPGPRVPVVLNAPNNPNPYLRRTGSVANAHRNQSLNISPGRKGLASMLEPIYIREHYQANPIQLRRDLNTRQKGDRALSRQSSSLKSKATSSGVSIQTV